MKKLYFITNLRSGKSVIRQKLATVIDVFTAAGFEVTIRPTQARMDACAAAEYACLSEQFDLIVCAGGDGTLNEVVQGLMHSRQPLPIGYIPCGSTNDFARTLHIPTEIEQAARLIVDGKPHRFDVGRFNSRYFLYVAAFGALTATVYDTPQNYKNILGHAAYLLHGMTQLSTIRPIHMRIEYDNDACIEDDFLLGMVCNTASVGGLLKLKNCALNDGCFEVLLIRNPSNILMLGNIITALRSIDDDINTHDVLYFRASRLTFTSDTEVSWTLDGEFGGTSSVAEVCNCRQAVSICTAPEQLWRESDLDMPDVHLNDEGG